MFQWLRNRITWGRVVSSAKAVAVISAFLAFTINVRQKELDRFSAIKPLFEIEAPTNTTSFKLINHGSVVYFKGCDDKDTSRLITDEKKACKLLTRTQKQYSTIPYEKNACRHVTKTPRRYSALGNNQTNGKNQTKPAEFHFSKRLSSDDTIISYWSDIDLNQYELKIKWKEDGLYIDGPPKTFRSDKYFSMSRPWLDWFANLLFPKDWFSDPKCWFSNEAPPKDDQLKVAYCKPNNPDKGNRLPCPK
jgi:hypothetical protein